MGLIKKYIINDKLCYPVKEIKVKKITITNVSNYKFHHRCFICGKDCHNLKSIEFETNMSEVLAHYECAINLPILYVLTDDIHKYLFSGKNREFLCSLFKDISL
jgi:hypothetical protein